MDALQALQDEVALEGLDGITIGGLWFRLEHRIPKLLLQLDCATKKFLWQALVCNSEIDFFELPQERPPLVYYDRFSEIDPETGIHEMKSERSPVEDVYPVHIVLENKDGIKGSCKFFKERVSVTHQIRTKDCKMHCSLEDASKRTDARKLHYLRKPLDRNNLVTLQSHVIRLPNGSQQHSVLLLLKRFHVDRRSKYALLMEKVCQILSSKEDNLSTMSHLKEELNICERTFKRLYQYLLAAGKAQIIVKPLQEIDPSATVCKTKKGTDIVVRCLKLLPEKKRTTEEDDENEDDDDKKIHQAEGRVVQRDLLTQAYELIESRGTKGASQTEIRQVMNLGKLESRMICRLLERFDKVKGFMEDEGRQRTTKYIAKCYVEHSKLNLQFAKEKARSEKLATTVSSLPTDIPTDEVLSPVPSSEEEIPVMEKSDAKPTMKKGNKNPELKIQTQFLLKNSKINKSIQNPKPVGTGASKTKKKENVKGTPVKSRASEAEGEEASEVTVVKSNDQAEKIGEDAPIIEEVCLESPCTSNVELVVHPSILPNDPLVKSAIEQVRFRMSSSYNASRMKFLQNKNGPDETQDKNSIENSGDNSQVPEQNHDGSTNQPESPCNPNNSKTDEKMGVKQLKNFHPLIVPGLGRSLGFLPKMPRLKLVHIFLWYLINEHPLRKNYEDNSIALPVNEKEKDNTEDALLSKENTCSDELQENLRNIQLDQFCYETGKIFVYMKRKVTIVDTSTCDPHYNLARSSRPFEKRFYNFTTLHDVENFWFDLQCVCLNTPLGIIRNPRQRKGNSEDLKNDPDLTQEKLSFEHILKMSDCSKLNRLLDSTTFGTVDVTDVHIQKRSVDTRNKGTASNKKLKRKKSKNSVGKKMKKNRKERKPQKKLDRPSAFHDEADRSALQRMTRQRVAWTAQEDGLLMLCRIAIHILNKKVKGPFVPWQAVRDVIHSNLEESLDKTSMSVGRRARHIMKNPQTLLNFKICVAEVYQDKDLTEKFLKRKSNYESPEVCAAEFKEFVEELRKKFSTTDGGFHLEIPDTKEELFRHFDDIYSAVLNNLIQSTLAMSDTQMKICQSFQTFYLYRKYREDLLYQVFKECQKKGLVNRRRVNQILGPKKSRALPFAAMSYQLSQSYYRFFTWRFPNTLCAELDRFSEQLKSVGSEDKPNNFSFMDKDTVDSKTEMMLFPMDAPGGYCLFSLSLFILGFLSVDVAIPEQIVVVDSAMMDNEVTKGLLKDGMDDEEEEEEAEDIENKRKIEVKARQASHTNYLLMRGFCSPGIVNTRNLNTCDNVVVNSCQLKVKLRVTPAHHWFCWPGISKVTEQISEDCQLPENFTRILRKSKDVCRLDRFRKLCVEEYGYSAEDLQAVLEISSAIEESKSFGCDKNDLRNKFLSFKERKEGRTRSLHQYVEDLIKLEEVLEVGANTQRLVAFKYSSPWLLHIRAAPLASKRSKNSRNISRSIKRKLEAPGEEDGAPSNKKAHVPFNNPTPEETSRSQEALSAPTEVTNSVTSMGSNLVLESREENQSTSRTSPDDGVHIKDSAVLAQEGRDPGQDPESGTWEDNAGDEIDDKLEENVTDEEKESKCEEISFISRPWRIVDGSLNKPVCKGMLEAMLFHIMTKPGIPDQTLIHHYKGVIQPVVVLELLQALETLGCIQKKQIKKSRKASLFSRPEILEEEEEEEDAVQTSSASTVFYEPAVDCCLKLAKLFPHEPNWNKWVPFIHT
ncbi:TF3C1 factor, partial [Polypterus senegalus]